MKNKPIEKEKIEKVEILKEWDLSFNKFMIVKPEKIEEIIHKLNEIIDYLNER